MRGWGGGDGYGHLERKSVRVLSGPITPSEEEGEMHLLSGA